VCCPFSLEARQDSRLIRIFLNRLRSAFAWAFLLFLVLVAGVRHPEASAQEVSPASVRIEATDRAGLERLIRGHRREALVLQDRRLLFSPIPHPISRLRVLVLAALRLKEAFS
jgi:hypothetical protein